MQPHVRRSFNVPPAGQPNSWGETLAASDPPCADTELGWTTSEDGQWEPMTVTRQLFVLSLLTGGFYAMKNLVLRHGWHRRR